MPKAIVRLAVQISTTGGSSALTVSDRVELDQEFGDSIELNWLPASVREDERCHAAWISTTVFVYALGLGLLFVGKPFLEGAAQEAGKDFWHLCKKLVSRIWRKQDSRAYALRATYFLIFELGDDFAAVPLRVLANKHEGATEADVEREIEQTLVEIAASWDRLTQDIKKFKVGADGRSQRMVHVFRRTESQWLLHAEDSAEFFKKGSL